MPRTAQEHDSGVEVEHRAEHRVDQVVVLERHGFVPEPLLDLRREVEDRDGQQQADRQAVPEHLRAVTLVFVMRSMAVVSAVCVVIGVVLVVGMRVVVPVRAVARLPVDRVRMVPGCVIAHPLREATLLGFVRFLIVAGHMAVRVAFVSHGLLMLFSMHCRSLSRLRRY